MKLLMEDLEGSSPPCSRIRNWVAKVGLHELCRQKEKRDEIFDLSMLSKRKTVFPATQNDIKSV